MFCAKSVRIGDHPTNAVMNNRICIFKKYLFIYFDQQQPQQSRDVTWRAALKFKKKI